MVVRMDEPTEAEVLAWASEAMSTDSGVTIEQESAYLLGEGPDPFPPDSERSARLGAAWLKMLEKGS